MSDPTDDLTLLASAYLDGEATPDERALVETSVDALAEVERLARVRTVLEATVEPVSLAAREAHLAAALDVWERMRDSTGDEGQAFAGLVAYGDANQIVAMHLGERVDDVIFERNAVIEQRLERGVRLGGLRSLERIAIAKNADRALPGDVRTVQ